MQIDIIPILKDNYAYLLRGADGKNAVIDPGEAAPVIAYLQSNDLKLDLIINTHHHGDHISGNSKLIDTYNCQLAAPKKEAAKIGKLDIELEEKSVFSFGGEKAKILETPGHTLGGICLYFPTSKACFSGDTLFSMGCGRLFEGTPAMMWESLQKIMALPPETRIFPGHEYTLENAKFCLSIEPDNADLKERMREIDTLRANNHPTIPVTLETEKKTNVFLRVEDAKKFAALRAQKDNF